MTGLLTRLTLKQCKTFSSQVPDDKDSPIKWSGSIILMASIVFLCYGKITKMDKYTSD